MRYEDVNNNLDYPYTEVQASAEVMNLVEWFSHCENVNSVMDVQVERMVLPAEMVKEPTAETIQMIIQI